MFVAPRIQSIVRGTPNYVAVVNPTDGLTGADLTPTAVTVRVLALDGITTHHVAAAVLSEPVSAALTAQYRTPVRAWVAQIPADDYDGALEVLVSRTLIVAGLGHTRTERTRIA